jgi:hypothetical protein
MAVEILGINQPVIGAGTTNGFSAGSIAGGTQGLSETIQQESEQNTQVKQTLVQDEKIIENLLKKQYGINVLDTGNIQVDKLSDIAKGLFNFIPAGFETYLLQGAKNKLIFNLTRPVLTFNLEKVSPQILGTDEYLLPQFSNMESPIDNNNDSLEPKKVKQPDISSFPILVYKTKNEPNSLEEIVNENNIYKKLIPSNGQLSFIDFLDIDTDYYFFVTSGQELLEKLSSLFNVKPDGTLEEVVKIPTNYVTKIRIIKDGESYFLEKQNIDLNSKNNENTKKFFGSIFVEPKYNFIDSTIKDFATKNAVAPFKQGESSFDSSNSSNYPYIKFRFKSKKSNRKFDVNLKYTISSQVQTLSEKQVNQVKGGKYTKLDSFVAAKPALKILDSKYSNFYSSSESRLSAKEFITEIEKITKEKTNNKVKIFISEIQKTDNQLTDIVFESATQDDMKMIKGGLSTTSPIFKLINKAKSGVQEDYLYFDLPSFLEYETNKPIFSETSVYGAAGNKFLPEDKTSPDSTIKTATGIANTFTELNDLYQVILEEYPDAVIEWDPLKTPFAGFKIYNLTLDQLNKLVFDYKTAVLGSDQTVGQFALGQIKYQYSYKTQNQTFYSEVPALENFKFLISLFKKISKGSYTISKASLGNFLANPNESREENLLDNFISELNKYYSEDLDKKINFVYNGKNDTLYLLELYKKDDLINFVNDYPTESYLKQIYQRLLGTIDLSEPIVEDAILQL